MEKLHPPQTGVNRAEIRFLEKAAPEGQPGPGRRALSHPGDSGPRCRELIQVDAARIL